MTIPNNMTNSPVQNDILFMTTSKLLKKLKTFGYASVSPQKKKPPPVRRRLCCSTVPSAGIIRIRSSGRVSLETPLSPVAPSSRVAFNKIGCLVEVCNQTVAKK
jgi:hypothetical protein